MATTPNIATTQKVVPMIYAYTTPEIARHNGWTKIGYTEQDVEKRIKQQTHTADVQWHLEWKGNAVFEDGSGVLFKDKDFHAYLRKAGIDNEPQTEWFKLTGRKSKGMFHTFRENHGILLSNTTVIPYVLREEQEQAVALTLNYKQSHAKSEFLWNAKPRFGKTLAVYDFCQRIKAEKVLVVTNRPAIANSWFEDYVKFLGAESGYLFVSEVEALKGKAGVLTREEYTAKLLKAKAGEDKCIEFVSLQDLKGSVFFGGHIPKLAEISDDPDEGVTWDVLVVDEAHEGVDTYKTDIAFDHIKRNFTMHLSGTPFKALANNKFNSDAIYNWTYADEQQKKAEWDENQDQENPYSALPQLNLFTYQMSEIVKGEVQQGIEINGETEEYAFDLNEFFSTTSGRFVYDSSVDKFLDALTVQKKFPFSTPKLRDELKHTFWLLDRVDSAKALANKLKNHPVFKDYEIILAAGDGRIDDADATEKSFDKVVAAIKKYDKTITLSVGQLTTGVTIPEWTGVLMLSNVTSPALYMQAAFRAQNPCMFSSDGVCLRKQNAYVFDFDPARTLIIFEKFANDLSNGTAAGHGDTETRKSNIRTLLNFFPVIGEDENGELIELDAEKVLTIPRKIKSKEVVRRGFMSNFLFQNISNIFGAPQAVLEILEKVTPAKEANTRENIVQEATNEIVLDEQGNVVIDDSKVIGLAKDMFGDKIYDTADKIKEAFEGAKDSKGTEALDNLKEAFRNGAVKGIVDTAKEKYGDDMRAMDKKQIESKLTRESDKIVEKTLGNYQIEKKVIEQKRSEAMQNRDKTGQTTAEIDSEFNDKQKEAALKFKEELGTAADKFVEDASKEVIKTVETKKVERIKDEVQDGVRDHLRGFTRTIPSFLMAYGDDTVTLKTFDAVVPAPVFMEVTSITIDQFKFLRDGGDYNNAETGKTEHFNGDLFDPIVFDDSVKEFLNLKKKLADYFDEQAIEDIFDYIPSQKTNQIFTPKLIVKKMVDMMEKENPGCFDNPDKTFIDMYMKSGLFITEIVKRLFQSPKMKELYPDKETRLKHIFEEQVYGLAPTEIIYKIATSYILGFDGDVVIKKHNFKQVDALPYAKEGTLQDKIDELFGK